jgi:hypothetical protein
VYENISMGMLNYPHLIRPKILKLLQRIFVSDMTSRPSLAEIKQHVLLERINFETLADSVAPWVPTRVIAGSASE